MKVLDDIIWSYIDKRMSIQYCTYLSMTYYELQDLVAEDPLAKDVYMARRLVLNIIEDRDSFYKILEEYSIEDIVDDYYTSNMYLQSVRCRREGRDFDSDMMESPHRAFGLENFESIYSAFRDAVMLCEETREYHKELFATEVRGNNAERLKLLMKGVIEIQGINFIDEVMQEAAEEEWERRTEIANNCTSDCLREWEDEEFMRFYEYLRNYPMLLTPKGEKINEQFGEYGALMHKNCEEELWENREYLIQDFVDYCEPEIKRYASYREEKLAEMLESGIGEEELVKGGCSVIYDKMSLFLISIILED